MSFDWETLLGCEDGEMLQEYYDNNIPEDNHYSHHFYLNDYRDFNDGYYEEDDYDDSEEDEEDTYYLDDYEYDNDNDNDQEDNDNREVNNRKGDHNNE